MDEELVRVVLSYRVLRLVVMVVLFSLFYGYSKGLFYLFEGKEKRKVCLDNFTCVEISAWSCRFGLFERRYCGRLFSVDIFSCFIFYLY